MMTEILLDFNFNADDNFVIEWNKCIAAVSCSPITPRLGGVKMGIWLMGKLGRAWHRCMAFLAGPVGPCMVHGGWYRCMAVHAVSCMGGVPAGVG